MKLTVKRLDLQSKGNGQLLQDLIRKVDDMAKTQAELASDLNKVTDQLKKVGTETSTLLTKIDDLTAIINNGPPVSPELQAAVDALTAQAKVVDDLVPDAPTPPSP